MLFLKISKRLTLLKVFLLICFFLQRGNAYAELLKELPNTVWDYQFGNDNLYHEYTAMAVSKKEDVIWIAGRSSSWPPNKPDSWKLLIWAVDQQGKRIREIKLKSPIEGKRLEYPKINDLKVLETGDIFMVVEMVGGLPSFSKIDTNGKFLFVKQLASIKDIISIQKIVPTTDQNFFLIGQKLSDAYVIKVTAEGNILWEKTIDREKTEIFFDGLSMVSGGVVLVGNSWTGDPFFAGPSDILLVNLDAQGKIVSETKFPGRYPSIARRPDNTYAIVYDKATSASQEIWFQAINADLKTLNNSHLVSIDRGIARFKIVPIGSGEFIIVGSKNFNLLVSRITIGGKIIWEYLSNNIGRRSSSFDLISVQNRLFVLSSVDSVNIKKQLNTKIGLIKFFQE